MSTHEVLWVNVLLVGLVLQPALNSIGWQTSILGSLLDLLDEIVEVVGSS